jgi:hypothetical protein
VMSAHAAGLLGISDDGARAPHHLIGRPMHCAKPSASIRPVPRATVLLLLKPVLLSPQPAQQRRILIETVAEREATIVVGCIRRERPCPDALDEGERPPSRPATRAVTGGRRRSLLRGCYSGGSPAARRRRSMSLINQ